MIMVMIVVIRRVIVLNPLSVSITTVCGTKSCTAPLTALLLLKENPYTSGSLCVFALQTERDWDGRANSCYASWVVRGPPPCSDRHSTPRVLKDTKVSGVEDEQSAFQLGVVRLWCAAPAGPEWQVCVGELADLSPDMRSACYNWALFHLLSCLFVCR